MENAADALKMAASVLIFVVAISIAILSFGQARKTADILLDYRDRETDYVYYEEASSTSREVGLETIIPTITRAYLENYKIVFEGLENPIYTLKFYNKSDIDKFTLDLETNKGKAYENVSLANDEEKIIFLRGVIYGEFDDFTNGYNGFKDKFSVTVPNNGTITLYKQLSKALDGGKTITESLGVYYQSDNSDLEEVNKTEKRVITYTIKGDD